MSKNLAPDFPELVALIVFSAVIPDWECKSGSFNFNMQAPIAKNCKTFYPISPNRLIKKKLHHEKIENFFDYAFTYPIHYRLSDENERQDMCEPLI